MDKKLIREAMLKKRESLPWLEMQGKSHQAVQLLQQLKQFHQARTLLIYLPIRNEIDTIPIIKTAWQLGKTVVIPVCQPGNELLLSRINSFNELNEGVFGIPEPCANHLRPVAAEQVDLAVLPGVAFDLNGNRLGFGGGYFDRLLPLLRADCPRLALAYDFQIVEVLPVKEHDIKMDIIVTENRIIYTK